MKPVKQLNRVHLFLYLCNLTKYFWLATLNNFSQQWSQRIANHVMNEVCSKDLLTAKLSLSFLIRSTEWCLKSVNSLIISSMQAGWKMVEPIQNQIHLNIYKLVSVLPQSCLWTSAMENKERLKNRMPIWNKQELFRIWHVNLLKWILIWLSV